MINVSVVFLGQEKQWFYRGQVSLGTDAAELIEQSGFLQQVDEINACSVEQLELGIYAERVTAQQLLADGDRLEIYRPLKADPKEVRRQLAELGEVMGTKLSDSKRS